MITVRMTGTYIGEFEGKNYSLQKDKNYELPDELAKRLMKKDAVPFHKEKESNNEIEPYGSPDDDPEIQKQKHARERREASMTNNIFS